MVVCLITMGAGRPVFGQAVTFFGQFNQYTQGVVSFGQGIVADASGNIYVSGTFNLAYIPVDTNGVPQTALEYHIDGTGTEAYGLAIDAANNLYRPDVAAATVAKYTYGGSVQSYVRTTIGTGWVHPSSVAVDSAFNLYVLDAGNGTISKLAPNGSGGYVQSVIYTDSALLKTTGLSLDAAGNFYLSSGPNTSSVDSTNVSNSTAAVYKLTPVSGSYTRTSLGTGWSSPASTTVDSYGNVWVADYSAGTINLLIPNGVGGYTQSVYTHVANVRTLTVSKTGEIYGFTSSAVIYAGGSAPHKVATTPTGTPTTIPVTLSFQVPVNATYSVVTQGVTGGDFTDAGTGTCSQTAASYTAGQTCTANVTFTPKAPGLRVGALVVKDATGAVIATNYFSGLGLGPVATFSPGTIDTSLPSLGAPTGVLTDLSGNVYAADGGAHKVFKVTGGAATTIAGSGTACTSATGTCGDGAAAASASITPGSLAMDGAGNLFIADVSANRIREIPAGSTTILTVAGTGAVCSGSTAACGDNGPASAAQLNLTATSGIAVDAYGQLLIADTGDNRVRSVNLTTGVITTVVGTGTACSSTTATCGDGGQAVSGNLKAPTGISVDSANNYLIADTGDNRIRMVSALTGVLSTVAGTGTQCTTACGDGSAATAAALNAPLSVGSDIAGNIFISDSADNSIREVDVTSGKIATVAGNGTACTNSAANTCGDSDVATNASLNLPGQLAVDGFGSVYIADNSRRIRVLHLGAGRLPFSATTISTTSPDSPLMLTMSNTGNAPLALVIPTGLDTNPAAAAPFSVSSSSTCPNLTSSSSANTLAAKASCTYLVSFAPTSGGPFTGGLTITDNNLGVSNSTQTSTLSGTALLPGAGPTLTVGTPSTPQTTTFTFTGNFTLGNISVVTQGVTGLDFKRASGNGGTCVANTAYISGQSCTVAYTFTPTVPGLRYGAIFLYDTNNNLVATQYLSGVGLGPVVLFQPGTIGTVVGTGVECTDVGSGCGDGGPSVSATLKDVNDMIYDSQHNFYIADIIGNVVRKVDTNGNITTVVGQMNVACPNNTNPCGDGGPGTSALLNGPTKLALDGAGNLYIADKFENRIRVYNLQTGIIKAFAGTGNQNYSGDGGSALTAELFSPDGLAIDLNGDVFIGDTGNQVVRKVTIATGKIQTIVTGTRYPNELRPDGKGNIYIANGTGNNVLKLDSTYHLTVVAGTGVQCSNPTAACGDGGPATSAQTGTVWSMVLDGAGNIYFTDNTDKRVRFVNATTGIISTLVGTGAVCNPTSPCGDGGVGTSATLDYPTSLAFDVQGNLLIGDDYARRIRRLQFAASSIDFGTLSPGTTGTKSITITNAGNAPLDLPIPTSGMDPSIAAGYTFDPSSTCPIVSSSSTASGSLAVGASCTYVVQYTATGGTSSGGFVITDNNLGIPGSTQGVALAGATTAPVSTKLGFGTLPAATVTAGSGAGAITVNVQDATGATDTTSAASVTITVTGPNGYSQTYTSTAVSGVATFNLTSPALTAAGGYTYTATATGLTQAAATETVTAAAATQVVVSGGNTTPTAGGNGGTVTLTVEDQYGNPVTTSGTSLPYTLKDSAGTVITSGTATTTNGVATVNLSGTTLTKAGTDTLTVTGTGLTTGTGTIVVTTATASKITTTGVPSTPVTAGTGLGPIISTVTDTYGNPVSGPAKTLTYTVTGPQPATTTIGTGTGTTSTTTGSATLDLSGVTPTVAGTYTVTVSGPGITPYQTTITVTASTTNDKLTVSPVPTVTAGTSAGPLTATVADQYNNTVTISSAPVVFSITGPTGYTPTTLTSTAVNGVATANLPNNLTIAGTYTVTATSNGIVTGTQTITVAPAAPSTVSVTGLPSPSSPLAPRSTLGPVVVTIVDQYGNPVTTSTITLAYTLTLPDGSTITGTATAVNGVITAFNPPIPLTQPGTYTLAVGGPGLTTSTSTFTVAQLVPTPVLTVSSPTAPFGTTLGTVLTSTATSGNSTVPGTWTYTATLQPNGPTIPVTAGTVLTGGSYIINGTFTPTDTIVYKTVSTTVALTITKITPAITVRTSVSPVLLLNPVTFTVTVTNATATPTGTVTFLDGTTSIGTGALVNGVATLTTTSLAVGTHPITASYGGDGNFNTVASSAISEVVQDFSLTISTASSSSTTATVIPGGTATYNLVVAPTTGTTFPVAVNLTVTGAPAGSTVTLTPSTIAAGAGSTPLVLTVATAAPHAMNTGFGVGKGIGVTLALLLLPFGRRLRRTTRRFGVLGVLFLILGLGGSIAGLTGCGSATGFLGQAPQTYTLTVTGTSGALTHSTTVTLTVQ